MVDRTVKKVSDKDDWKRRLGGGVLRSTRRLGWMANALLLGDSWRLSRRLITERPSGAVVEEERRSRSLQRSTSFAREHCPLRKDVVGGSVSSTTSKKAGRVDRQSCCCISATCALPFRRMFRAPKRYRLASNRRRMRVWRRSSRDESSLQQPSWTAKDE